MKDSDCETVERQKDSVRENAIKETAVPVFNVKKRFMPLFLLLFALSVIYDWLQINFGLRERVGYSCGIVKSNTVLKNMGGRS